MRILAIGDFHGKFPKKFEKIIRKEKIDLVVSVGDYFPFHYRKLWFKHCYGEETELLEVIGKKKYKELVLKDLKMGEKVLEKVNKLPAPVFTVVGNIDYSRTKDAIDHKPNRQHRWKWDEQDFFSPIIKKYKNIKRFDYSYFRFGDFIFIGAYGGTFPGKVKSKQYKKQSKILDRLFNKFKKENKQKKVIFVSHNVPYKTKLDKLDKKAQKISGKKHTGSKIIKRIIGSHQPILHIAGHIHERQGGDKIGKTLCVNVGAVYDGRAVVIKINDKKRVKVKFIK